MPRTEVRDENQKLNRGFYNHSSQESNEDEDGETPYQEDYLPAGLHEAEAGNGEEAETTVEEINEKLLDDEEEEVVEDERSWKRRANDED